ncbi:hypothetical protein [Gordonia rubripertincta]|uniref:hypothetical protein n=1 Tax=Gordonia rubripertincta TaxID=36822 RepID=UPI0015FAB01D|nr:hypothetical protein [Gordonia rubripertincta]QMU19043.1 hypothetical protein H3V45_13075 [Gordonia rubripertincta]
MNERITVKVAVAPDELREWAGKHADAGHHGVAHVLYEASGRYEKLIEAATAPVGERIRTEFLVAAETMPCPDGWSWTVVDHAAYYRACQDGIPTLHLEFGHDDAVEFVYLVGRHDLDEVTP